MRTRSDSFPVVLIFAVAVLALALHGFQREIVGATVARSFHDMFGFQAGELLRRLTEMAIPIAAAVSIVAFLYRYLSAELALPLDAGPASHFQVPPIIYCTSKSIMSLNGDRTGLYKNTFFLQVKNDRRPVMTLKNVQARLFHLGRPVLARIRGVSCGSVDLGPGESMLVEVGAIVSFRASGSRTGDLTMPEQMAAKHFHDVSNGHLSFDVEDFRGKRRYGLAPQESRDSVRELLLAISAGEVRSLHLVVSIDIANPESPIKRIKEVNSTGWTPELRELRQPERRGSFSGNYKERSALLHMSLN